MATISVPDETYRRLEERAAAVGTTVEKLVLPLLDQSAPQEANESDRRRAFEHLMKLIHSHAPNYPPGHVLDVSRDAAYEDRLRGQL